MGHVSPHRTGQGPQAVSPKATSGVPAALPGETSPTLLGRWGVGWNRPPQSLPALPGFGVDPRGEPAPGLPCAVSSLLPLPPQRTRQALGDPGQGAEPL